ncbi:hypothetical protein HPB52_006502 [Rhipicephalus sanguineus]|uniref:Myb-like domain-containing protein n=1 Tax=Rhipicephalus sanguineus TaxID=34632 RepID=A0A9D4QHS0_RHISA|nr:hypothetical protein HPB52_006502 [Rhipicephalus sanguineus]
MALALAFVRPSCGSGASRRQALDVKKEAVVTSAPAPEAVRPASASQVSADVSTVVGPPVLLDSDDESTGGASSAGHPKPTSLGGSAAVSQRHCARNDNASCEWTEGETKLLLDIYHEYLRRVGPMKLFKNKKATWRAISFDIEDTLGLPKTPEQCENRFKTVKKRRCHQRAHNRSSGVEPVQEEYSEEFRKIEAADDSLKPDLLRGPGRVEFKAATASAV